jgi:glycosyltransferase involved in cell wall biosynthesis
MSNSSKPSITFVLSSINRSGGSRVTVDMGNLLIKRGYPVRIACPKPKFVIKQQLRKLWLQFKGVDYEGWGREFVGKIAIYNHIDDLSFVPGEIVIAVGTHAIEPVRNLRRTEIKKVRFCHGFIAGKDDLMKQVWGGSMNTISVSATHVPYLEKFSGEKVLGVVPNGIKTDLYFEEDIKRDGIGTIFNPHYNKAPEYTMKLLMKIRERWPDVPLYVFGKSRRPSEIPSDCYWQYPSVECARSLYNRSKIWLMTSRTEGFGLPNLEAMACGAVMVSSDNIGSAEIIRHDENGYLIPVGDIDAYLPVIERILSDDNERKRIVANGRKTVAEFSWDNAVQKMEEVISLLSE